jgi:hypothetical protein
VKADLGGLELISEELFIKSGAKTQGNGPLNSAATPGGLASGCLTDVRNYVTEAAQTPPRDLLQIQARNEYARPSQLKILETL